MKVIWTEEASSNVDAIVKYLDKHWSKREADDFLTKRKASSYFSEA